MLNKIGFSTVACLPTQLSWEFRAAIHFKGGGSREIHKTSEQSICFKLAHLQWPCVRMFYISLLKNKSLLQTHYYVS